MEAGRAVLVILLAIHCTTSVPREETQKAKKLGREEAIALAVQLANNECDRQFGATPFDASSFDIDTSEARWRWGMLDVHGVKGYSAKVSFDLKGEKDSVEVYLSTDIHDRHDIDRRTLEDFRKKLESK